MSTELRTQFSGVQERLQQTLAALDFGGQIDACFAPVEALCVELEDAAGEDILEAIPRDARLEEHTARYTMQDERNTHRAAASARGDDTTDAPAKQPAAAASAAVPAPAPAAAGGDIELF